MYNDRNSNKYLPPPSSEAVSKKVEKGLGAHIPSGHTIYELIQNGHVGITPSWPGKPGWLKLLVYIALCAAVGSFGKFYQVNGEEEVQVMQLIQIVNLVVNEWPS